MKSLKKKISKIKNKNPWLKYVWFKVLKQRERKARKISDIECIIYNYYNAFGNYPSLENPKFFFEKLQWLKLNYRNPLMPIVSDKFLVHQYLKDLGYGYLLNHIIGVWDNIKDFNPNELPQRFVLKATHSSGDAWNLIVRNNHKFNWFANKKVMSEWLNNSIDWLGREWHYGEMKPRIIGEEYLEDSKGELVDYKFHCINGEPQFVIICMGRYTEKKRFLTFDKAWNILPFTNDSKEYINKNIKLPSLPQNYDEMWKLAGELSKPFPYVRVDFYNVDGKIYFGEFTFFSSSGFKGPYSEEAQKYMGDAICLPEANVSDYNT